MTTDENPADTVTEAAAKAICRTRCGPMFIERNGRACNQHQRDGEVAGRTLHNAGLLADPADRDEIKAPLIREIKRLQDQIARARMDPGQDRQKAVHAYADRAERAEAERDVEYRKYAQEADRAETLEAEVAELRQKWLAFTSALGFGNNRTEPAAELSEMIDPIEQAFSDAGDHQECAVICELCGEPLASKTCDECHGSGCLPNSRLAYLECGTCAGAGKVHEGCVEKSYAELVAERDELRATIAALGGAGEQP